MRKTWSNSPIPAEKLSIFPWFRLKLTQTVGILRIFDPPGLLFPSRRPLHFRAGRGPGCARPRAAGAARAAPRGEFLEEAVEARQGILAKLVETATSWENHGRLGWSERSCWKFLGNDGVITVEASEIRRH